MTTSQAATETVVTPGPAQPPSPEKFFETMVAY